MASTKITWDEVKNYDKVSAKNNIYKNNGQYYFVTEEGGIASQIVVYELSHEKYQLLESGKRNASEIHFKLKNGSWPMSREENKKYYEEHGINDMLAKIKREATENYDLSK